MEIRLFNKEAGKVFKTSSDIDEIADTLCRVPLHDRDKVEVQLVYTNTLVRIIDVPTFFNANDYIIAFIKTSYYSGQADGSFTVADAKDFETILPHLFTIENLDDEDINFQLKEILNNQLSIRLISCNHILLTNPYAIIDSLIYHKEQEAMQRMYAPQNDYTEYMITHIVAYDKLRKTTYKIKDEGELYSLIFSSELLYNLDKEIVGY